ncbi:MAG: universal stress protein [Flavobacteriaceae bacterium]
MRKVVVPTDFSENAFHALKYACQVFKYERSEFYIVHAYADEVYTEKKDIDPSVFEQKKATARTNSEMELAKVLNALKLYSPNPDHQYHTLSAFGSLTDEVNDLVTAENMDIVVMGTKGFTNDRKVSFGSNTLAVMKYVDCPVLAIPEGYVYEAPRSVLFPTDYQVPFRKRELKLLCEMTGSFRSTIHFLYIFPLKYLCERQSNNQEFLKEGLKKASLVFETSPEKNKTEAIMKYIGDHQIDMLVMVNTRQSHLEYMLYQSTLDQIGLHIKIPFLVLQNLAR